MEKEIKDQLMEHGKHFNHIIKYFMKMKYKKKVILIKLKIKWKLK